jgi:hypothetical protein
MRKVVAIILLGLGVAEMVWGKLWGPARIKVLEGRMFTDLGLHNAQRETWPIFNQYIQAFKDIWIVVFWFGLATVVLGIILMICEQLSASRESEPPS